MNKKEVKHPSRYNKGEIECIDAIAVATSNLKGIKAVDTGNAIKYLWRWADKEPIISLEKSVWYIKHLIKKLKKAKKKHKKKKKSK